MAINRMPSTCPTCQLSDVQYKLGLERGHRSPCLDPWHGDAHLRRSDDQFNAGVKARVTEGLAAIDKDALRQAADFHNSTTIRMRAETSRRSFEDMLEHFVAKWAPDHERGYGRDRDDFQRDLMMLMRDAMQHQGNVYGMHIERTESTIHNLVNTASAPLNAIFHPPKKEP